MKKILILSALLSVAAAANAALVTNGDFETGNFTGWTQFDNTGFTGVEGGGVGGSYDAYFGPVGSTGGITQDLTTSVNAAYEIDFDLQHDGGTPNSFDISFGGTSLLSYVDTSGFGYTHYTLYTNALATTSALTFTFRQDPAYYRLDNVSVQAVPEPASMAALGLGGLAFLRRRRKA